MENETADRIERLIADASPAVPSAAELASALRLPLREVQRGLRLLLRTGCLQLDRDGRPASGPMMARLATASNPVPGGARDLSDGNPDPALLPRLFFDLTPETALYGEPRIVDELIRASAAHLRGQGVREGPVTVLPGGLEAVDRSLGTLLDPGDRVIVEHPTYNGDLPLLSALGLRAVPVAVDESGFDPDQFSAACVGAAACLMRPRAQNPTGAALSEERATALRTIVREHPGLLVIEEDHAGPVAGQPYRSMIPPDHLRWLHIASVSKWLSPDLRFAFLTGAPSLVRRIDQRRLLGGGWVSRQLQCAVANAMTTPPVRDAMLSAREHYTARRDAVRAALRRYGITSLGRSGLNVWIPVEDEAATMARLIDEGWLVSPGTRFGLVAQQAIRVTIAGLDVPEATRFAAALHRSQR